MMTAVTRTFLMIGLILLAAVLPLAVLPLVVTLVVFAALVATTDESFVDPEAQASALLASVLFRGPPSR